MEPETVWELYRELEMIWEPANAMRAWESQSYF
jgi:hypothetical protein